MIRKISRLKPKNLCFLNYAAKIQIVEILCKSVAIGQVEVLVRRVRARHGLLVHERVALPVLIVSLVRGRVLGRVLRVAGVVHRRRLLLHVGRLRVVAVLPISLVPAL